MKKKDAIEFQKASAEIMNSIKEAKEDFDRTMRELLASL
jgi:hypothetical protein